MQSNLPEYQAENGLGIDFKRVAFQALRFWYLIILSILICLSVSYLRNRYAVRIYSVDASIIIKEAEDVTSGKLLYNNPLVKFNRNYLNEIYILKSSPLMERTVSQLKLEHSFSRIGNVLTTEFYKSSPVQVQILENNQSRSFSFEFDLINETQYRIYDLNEESESETKGFGEVVDLGGVIISINKKEGKGGSNSGKWLYSYTPSEKLAGQYIGRINAGWAEEGAGVINLSITGANPEKEIDFVNGLIENYQDYDLEKKNLTASNTIDFINKQLAGISDSLKMAERQLELFKNKNIVTDLNLEASRLYQKLEGLEIQKTELIIAENYYDYITKYLSETELLDQAILPTSVGIADPILGGLMEQMMTIQAEIRLLTRTDKVKNPIILEKNRVLLELKEAILEAVKNQKSTNEIRLDFLKKGIHELEKQLNYLPIAERQLVNIKRNYSLLENLYVFLLQKRAEAGISMASNSSDIIVVNPPKASGPISPLVSRNNTIAFGIGVAIPILILILLELLNNKVQSREDVEKITSIPFVGGVGHKKGEQNVEVFEKPKSSISESFRALRSNLSFFLEKKEKGIFLITSSISGEGKTFSSINMAGVFALSGKKTLIVGADMRKPKIFGDLKLHNNKGLSNYLAGLNKFEEVLQQTQYTGLDLVSGGPVPPNPSELLLGERMKQFLDDARQHYDFIFIDSPPLALVTDAFVLSSLVDHTIFIVRQNYTPKNLLKTVNEYYVAGKIKKMSIVLNDIYKSGPGYGYGYGYSYGYGYGYGNKSYGQGYYTD
jgi:capsular exopolysaccharide synthesis family protein